ncbi:MAG: septum formation initiator family protein [Candidatus Pacebacteria bacterium]|nr:septum formation initiator family protein [Candidatus Paceibacterota bacterium]
MSSFVVKIGITIEIKMLIKKKKKNIFGRFSFQIVVIVVLVVVFVMGSALSKELYREYQIKKEVDALKAEIESMENDNYELSQMIEYYKTEEYKEAEARKRLNLKAEGEKVVMISESESEYEEIVDGEKGATIEISNRLKWWNYFFASR